MLFRSLSLNVNHRQVLVTKTLEQATLEVEEEAEIVAMKEYKESWIKDRIGERKVEEEAVEEERQRYNCSEKPVAKLLQGIVEALLHGKWNQIFGDACFRSSRASEFQYNLRHAATQKIKKQRLDLREDNIRRKTMCQYASRHFLKDLTANAIYSLQHDHGLLRNKEKKEIVCDFMPSVLVCFLIYAQWIMGQHVLRR